MKLEIDIGNTRLKWRTVDAGRIVEQGACLTSGLGAGMPAVWPEGITDVTVANVAGPAVAGLVSAYAQMRWQVQPVFAITQAVQAGVHNSYAEPRRMGVDRWLAMVAAYNACRRECCVVDCGSAITVDHLSATGVHLGGYIIPGLRLMSESLQRNTAEVLVEHRIESFELSPGCHTSAAVTHGVNYAFKALQERILRELQAQNPEPALYITGGDGELFYRLCGMGEYHPDLVLDGLAFL
jgi:type III pantothenate kinase